MRDSVSSLVFHRDGIITNTYTHTHILDGIDTSMKICSFHDDYRVEAVCGSSVSAPIGL